MRRGLETTNVEFEKKLMAEREVLADRFHKARDDLNEMFKRLEDEVKSSIDSHVESIKANFANELK